MTVTDVLVQARLSKGGISQLVFMASASLVIFGLGQRRKRPGFDMPAVARLAPAYAIGGLSAYWLIARMPGLF